MNAESNWASGSSSALASRPWGCARSTTYQPASALTLAGSSGEGKAHLLVGFEGVQAAVEDQAQSVVKLTSGKAIDSLIVSGSGEAEVWGAIGTGPGEESNQLRLKVSLLPTAIRAWLTQARAFHAALVPAKADFVAYGSPTTVDADLLALIESLEAALERKNSGKTIHEIVFGTMKELKEHAELMRKHPGMEHDEPYMAHVAPGKSERIVWQFTKAGEFYYGCLIPGHFEAGMIGKVIVK